MNMKRTGILAHNAFLDELKKDLGLLFKASNTEELKVCALS